MFSQYYHKVEKKLIEAVSSRKILYDNNHEDYAKMKIKGKIWHEIAKEADIRSGPEAKAVWERLRHSYRDAIRRQEKLLKSGAYIDDIKKWKYQREMAFLLPFMSTKSSISYDDPKTQTLSKFSDESQDSVIEEKEQDQEEMNRDEEQLQSLLDILPDSPVAPVKSEVSEMSEMIIENPRSLKESQPPCEADDPLYLFFMSMYHSTRNMPLASQFAVRNEIFKVVTDMEKNLLGMI